MNIHTNKHYQNVLAFLRTYSNIEDIPTTQMNKIFADYEHDIIRQAIKDRYAAKYRVLTHFKKDKSIQLEKVEYKEGEFKQEDLIQQAHALFIATLADKKEEILKGVEGRDELYRIDAITRDFILGTAENLHDTNQAFKLVKDSLSEVLNLQERDVVLTSNGEIYVKKFVCKIQKEEERIKSLENTISLDDVFKKIGINETVKKTVEELTTTTFNFTTTHPSAFSEKYLSAFMKMVSTLLIEDGIDTETATVTAKKLFREEAHLILTLTAKKLLERVSEKDKEAEHFLMWFDGATEVDDKGRFQRPFLADANQNRFPPTVIKGDVILYRSQMVRLKEARKVKEATDTNIAEQIEKIEKLQEEFSNIKSLIDIKNQEILSLKKEDKFLQIQFDDKLITQEEYTKARKAIDLINKVKGFENAIIEFKKDEEKLNIYIKEARRVLDGYERNNRKSLDDIKGIEFTLTEPRKRYNSYIEAISKALMTKKVRL